MGSIYKVNETADFEFIFLDASSNEPIDVINPVYTIVRFNAGVEVVIVPSTALTRTSVGKYTASWTIPPGTVLDETYFVRASATHPIYLTTTVLDDSFKVVADSYFSQEGGLIIKFTKD